MNGKIADWSYTLAGTLRLSNVTGLVDASRLVGQHVILLPPAFVERHAAIIKHLSTAKSECQCDASVGLYCEMCAERDLIAELRKLIDEPHRPDPEERAKGKCEKCGQPTFGYRCAKCKGA